MPEERKVVWALLFPTGGRLGEVLGLGWRDIDEAAEPLRRLAIARSYSQSTKRGGVREMPVHPVLSVVLAEWSWP